MLSAEIFTQHAMYQYICFQSSSYNTFLQSKSADIFLISAQKCMLWHSLEVPHPGTSNEYPQHTFSCRNKKNIMWILTLN